MMPYLSSLSIAFAIGPFPIIKAALLVRSFPQRIEGRSDLQSLADENGAARSDDLPIQPQITPALAISGVILILTGTAYLLTGIKNRTLQIFLSAAYLTSLAVTILLVHLVDPPISNAVQGVYLVAITMPGLTLGAISLLITEITEGLGSLFGGFGVSMWFLVMKPGGLMDRSASKILFISTLTLVAYALSFSRWTKEYILVVMTSFAGATVAVLGADCFTRAGLKEFWLYIWALNDTLFPPLITTYPITRGMKAEIALIFIAFLGGLISQVKALKVIKQRRQEQAAVLVVNQRQHEQEEEDLGKRLEEGNQRERVHWEAFHRDGRNEWVLAATVNKGPPDSLRDSSLSIVGAKQARECPVSIEMESLTSVEGVSQSHMHEMLAESTSSASADHQITHNGRQEFQHDASRVHRASKRDSSHSSINLAVEDPSEPDRFPSTPDGGIKAGEVRLSGSTISSTARASNTVSVAQHEQKGAECQLSRVSKLGPKLMKTPKRLLRESISNSPHIKSTKAVSECEEAFLVPKVDLGRNCSLAKKEDPHEYGYQPHAQQPVVVEPAQWIAGIEPEDSISELPVALASQSLDGQSGSTLIPHTIGVPESSQSHHLHLDIGVHPQQTLIPNEPLGPTNDSDFDEGGPTAYQTCRSKITPNERMAAPSGEKYGRSRSRALSTGGAEVLTTNTVNTVAQLASHAPKNIAAYRTDEWARRVSVAEQPDIHLLKRPLDSGDVTKRYHQPKVSDVHRVSRQAGTDAGVPGPLTLVPRFSFPDGPERAEISRSVLVDSTIPTPTFQKPPSQALALAKSPLRPHLCLSSNPRPSQGLITRGIHGDPAQIYGQPLVKSPSDNGSNTLYSLRSTSVDDLPDPPSTLLMQRQKRLCSQDRSAGRGASSSSFRSLTVPSDVLYQDGIVNLQGQDDDMDDIALSERRPIVQGSRRAAAHYAPRLSLNNPFFDSHQPQRSSQPYGHHRREGMLSAWRESLRWDRAAKQDLQTAVEGRWVELFLEQRRERQQQTIVAKQRDDLLNHARQTGELERLHREAMRRMQATAKTCI